MSGKETGNELSIPDMEAIRGGSCSAGMLRELKGALEVSDIELAGIVGIPRQTMHRRLPTAPSAKTRRT